MSTLTPEAVRADMADTREEIASTVEEIRERVEPELLYSAVEQGLTHGRRRVASKADEVAQQAPETVRMAGSALSRYARQNPLVAASLGLGLSWLLARYTERFTVKSHKKRPKFEDRKGTDL